MIALMPVFMLQSLVPRRIKHLERGHGEENVALSGTYWTHPWTRLPRRATAAAAGVSIWSQTMTELL